MSGIDGEGDPFHCPTCGARQSVIAPECRRCRCDLSLVLAIRAGIRELHRSCLQSLASGRAADALEFARRRHALSPDATSRRLVAVALLCLDRFGEAVQVHDQAKQLSE